MNTGVYEESCNPFLVEHDKFDQCACRPEKTKGASIKVELTLRLKVLLLVAFLVVLGTSFQSRTTKGRKEL